MRNAAIGGALLLALLSCSTAEPAQDHPYQRANQLMAGEIDRRIEQIPFQHREELLQNLMWLAQTGEQTIPALLQGLRHENPKVRSSSAFVLGRLRDRRTIPSLQRAVTDDEPSVRMEVARALVLMGDLAQSPQLIEGLDSERKEVRFLCHEALKTATGHDFGYDHLNQDTRELKLSTLRWRQWWAEYSGDAFFAQDYQQRNGLTVDLAAPLAEPKGAVRNNSGRTPTGGGANELPLEGAVQPINEPAINRGITPIESPTTTTTTTTELPKAELPKAELPKTELPKAEMPKTELPKTGNSKPNGR